MNPEENSFIREIKSAMQRLGWNQSQLARALETQPGVITRWMQGQPPRLESMQKIARVLDIPLAALIYDSQPSEIISKPGETNHSPSNVNLVSELPRRYHAPQEPSSSLNHHALEQTLDEIRIRLINMSRALTPAERERLQEQCVTRIQEFTSLCASNS